MLFHSNRCLARYLLPHFHPAPGQGAVEVGVQAIPVDEDRSAGGLVLLLEGEEKLEHRVIDELQVVEVNVDLLPGGDRFERFSDERQAKKCRRAFDGQVDAVMVRLIMPDHRDVSYRPE